MLSGDENETKPMRKPRKGKTEQDGKKAESRKRKAAPRAEPLAEQLLEAAEAISTPVASAENSLMDTSPSEASPIVPAEPAETGQPQNPQPDRLLEAAEMISAPVTPIETIPVDASPAMGTSLVPVVPAVAEPVSYQTIADAYRRYTVESLDRTQTFFGRLAGVRTLDKAFELQTEFAKQAYDGFVAESRKLRELHGQLARQRLSQWEGFVARMISPR
jgi:Phasin protein